VPELVGGCPVYWVVHWGVGFGFGGGGLGPIVAGGVDGAPQGAWGLPGRVVGGSAQLLSSWGGVVRSHGGAGGVAGVRRHERWRGGGGWALHLRCFASIIRGRLKGQAMDGGAQIVPSYPRPVVSSCLVWCWRVHRVGGVGVGART